MRLNRLVDHLAAEPVRVAALLRPPMIVLIVLIVHVGQVTNWLPAVYDAVLVGYALAALVWLVVVLRGPVPAWAGWVSTVVDVLVVVTLCLSSGGATAWLLPVFFLLPISIAFQDRPWVTGVLGVTIAFAYLAVWIVYSKRDDTVGMPNIVYLHFAFLLWFAAATTALCLVLARRRARVLALLESRRQLVAEAMLADEQHSRELAENLHDGPLQELLAARMQLDELSERVDDPALDAVRQTLAGTATALRSGLRALHPAVLSELGLTPAVAELLRDLRDRGQVTVRAELDEVGHPPAQDLLYRAARELLGSAGRRATEVQVTLTRDADWITLTVADNGAAGGIGPASLQTRVEAMGGTIRTDGTRTTVRLPAG